MTREQMRALAKSILDFGNVAPVIVDQNNMIVDGEHRVAVYRDSLKLREVPVIRVRVASDEERRLMRQTLNKLRGFIDPAKDAREIERLLDVGLGEDLSALLATDAETLRRLVDAASPREMLREISELEERAYGGGDADLGAAAELAQQQQQHPAQPQGEVGGATDYGSVAAQPPALVFRFFRREEYDRVVAALRKLDPHSMERALLGLVEVWER